MIDIMSKAKPVRLLLLDVDGIFTEGIIYLGDHEHISKGFHIQDGLGIKLLQSTGVKVGIISGKKADFLQNRMQSIGVEYIYLGHEQKLPIYNQLKEELHITDSEIAYMGDDLIDLPILSRVGFAITVPDGNKAVKPYCHYETECFGGKGAVREICDIIMQAQGKYQTVLNSYLV